MKGETKRREEWRREERRGEEKRKEKRKKKKGNNYMVERGQSTHSIFLASANWLNTKAYDPIWSNGIAPSFWAGGFSLNTWPSKAKLAEGERETEPERSQHTGPPQKYESAFPPPL